MLRALLKSISRREWLIIIVVSLFVIALTSAPYLYGWLIAPIGYHYTGIHSLTPGDVHVYYSYLEQAKQGRWFFSDLYTTESQPHPLIQIVWLAIGLGARLFSLNNPLALQLARLILIPFLIFILYLVATYFFSSKNQRLLGFILLVFASGWGAAASPFLESNVYQKGWYNWPLDLWAPESNTFLTMLQSPHLILSTAFIILVLWLYFLALEHQQMKYSLSAGVLCLILFTFHPFHIPTLLAIMLSYLVYQFIKHKKISFRYGRHFFLIALISSPAILYYFWLSYFDDLTRFRTLQNICLTPSWWVTLISFAPLLLSGIYALAVITRQRTWDNKKVFLLIWFLVQLICIYSPLPWQRRMLQGWQVPLTIFATLGLLYFYNYLRRFLSPDNFNFYVRNKYLALILFLVIFCPSQIFNFIREFSVLSDPKYTEQLYISSDRFAGYQWLKEHLTATDHILSDVINGNLIPGQTGQRVFIGHGVETLFFNSKSALTLWFFQTNDHDDLKQQFLRDNHLNYLFFSATEDAIGDFDPVDKNYLHPVFKSGQTTIYQVDLK